ncbi:MAG: ADP-ribosylglycohydrolase family protein [Oscillatoria princeps RMCB-10]|nr:ADP-ribosylglycohydrolase family protein [Oscillatoria princeps RMCB-10]
MRYSLLSRFQGALLGAAAGEVLGAGCQGRSRAQLQQLRPGVGGRGLRLDSPGRGSQAAGLGRLAVAGAESLIQCGVLNVSHWGGSEELSRTSRTGAGAAAAICLPMALFYHENEEKLLSQLHGAVLSLQSPRAASSGVLAVGCALGMALKEKLDPQTLIRQTIACLEDAGAVNPATAELLARVESLLERGACLEMAAEQLGRREPAARAAANGSAGESSPDSALIALAFYCFLSSPEDMRLSVMRAVRAGFDPILTGMLTGALSGAYNSTAGMPVGWRAALSQPAGTSPLNELWGVAGAAEILQLAARLLAAWSGVYQPAEAGIESCRWGAVAAPQIIRPR